MAFIPYLDDSAIKMEDRVDDDDNILRIHGVHSRVLKLHYDLYKELMHSDGPLSREQRELIGVAVSHINDCHY